VILLASGLARITSPVTERTTAWWSPTLTRWLEVGLGHGELTMECSEGSRPSNVFTVLCRTGTVSRATRLGDVVGAGGVLQWRHGAVARRRRPCRASLWEKTKMATADVLQSGEDGRGVAITARWGRSGARRLRLDEAWGRDGGALARQSAAGGRW
jgi:hypothetical protein